MLLLLLLSGWRCFATDTTAIPIRSMTVPRIAGYKIRMTEEALIQDLRNAGLRCERYDITSGRYFYDTSWLSLNRKREERVTNEHYWQVYGLTDGVDTIPRLEFMVSVRDVDERRVEAFYPRTIYSRYAPWGVASVEPWTPKPPPASTEKHTREQRHAERKAHDRRWRAYRERHRRYTRLIRRQFVKKFVKPAKK